MGCSPWGCKELDTTELLHFHFSLSCTGEGNGNPLQCSYLENPRDGGAWWASVYEVAQSQTGLQWLSSSSSRERNGCPLQYSCLENSMDRGAWWVTDHGVTKRWMQQNDWHFHFTFTFIGYSGHPWRKILKTTVHLVQASKRFDHILELRLYFSLLYHNHIAL